MSINPQLLVADTGNNDASEGDGADEQELGEREFFVGTWPAHKRGLLLLHAPNGPESPRVGLWC